MFGSIEGIGYDHYVTDWDFGKIYYFMSTSTEMCVYFCL